jgi:hypothetical protein
MSRSTIASNLSRAQSVRDQFLAVRSLIQYLELIVRLPT